MSFNKVIFFSSSNIVITILAVIILSFYKRARISTNKEKKGRWKRKRRGLEKEKAADMLV